MWALLVLALALAVGPSDTNNDTAADEKLVIARGKLLVSTSENPFALDTFHLVMSINCLGFCYLLSLKLNILLDKRTGAVSFIKQRGKYVR